MSPVEPQVLPPHLREDNAGTSDFDLLMVALESLPAATHQRILANFVITSRRCEITRDYGPLRHLTESLFATAALHADGDYRAAVDRARELDGRSMGELVGVEEFKARRAAQRS